MYSTAFLFRLAKVLSVSATGVWALLIVVGNTTDYYTNYYFVEHVMKMDTVFASSNIHYRNISNPVIFHAGYILIIMLEMLMAFCCLKGGWLLFRNLKNEAAAFNAAKNWAIAGLIVGAAIWFFGFEVIGGEWFAMWQSTAWNGLGSAERMVSFIVLILILLQHKDDPIQEQQ